MDAAQKMKHITKKRSKIGQQTKKLQQFEVVKKCNIFGNNGSNDKKG